MTSWDWLRARSMWDEGINTYDIAQFFFMPEHVIYNGLSKLRDCNNE